jgi:hypothetical protein
MKPKTKLKDLKYEIAGTETFKPAKELLGCLAIAFITALIAYIGIITVLYHADLIDSL